MKLIFYLEIYVENYELLHSSGLAARRGKKKHLACPILYDLTAERHTD